MTEVPIRLDPEEWQRVLAYLAQAPWGQVNTIIMKMGAQLQAASAPPAASAKGNGAAVEAAPEA
jgi:hypothetical protein